MTDPSDANAPIDLALVLAFDGSGSVTFDEFGLMTRGVGQALRDPTTQTGMVGGAHRACLCAVLLWSGHEQQQVMVPWTRITDHASLDAFATLVEDMPRDMRPGTTAIGNALMACEALLADLPAMADRRVIDVAGDGRSNDGVPPGPVRDRLVAAGTTINGLCILHTEADLLASYTSEVIGGVGSFALQCQDYAGFADAMQQKLTREVAGIANPPPSRA